MNTICIVCDTTCEVTDAYTGGTVAVGWAFCPRCDSYFLCDVEHAPLEVGE